MPNLTFFFEKNEYILDQILLFKEKMNINLVICLTINEI